MLTKYDKSGNVVKSIDFKNYEEDFYYTGNALYLKGMKNLDTSKTRIEAIKEFMSSIDTKDRYIYFDFLIIHSGVCKLCGVLYPQKDYMYATLQIFGGITVVSYGSNGWSVRDI